MTRPSVRGRRRGRITGATGLEHLTNIELAALQGNVIRENHKRFGHPPMRKPSDLAAMSVGETKVFTNWAMYGYRRIEAREELGDPNAQWTSRSVAHGCRVTRIR